jgi:hypothetical protein
MIPNAGTVQNWGSRHHLASTAENEMFINRNMGLIVIDNAAHCRWIDEPYVFRNEMKKALKRAGAELKVIG